MKCYSAMFCSEWLPGFSYVKAWSQDGDIRYCGLLGGDAKTGEVATKVTRIRASKDIMGCGVKSFASLG